MVEREGAPGAPARVLVEDLGGIIRRDVLLRRFEATLSGNAADAPVEIEAEAGEAAAGKPASLFLDLVHCGGGHHARLQFQGFGILTGEASELKGRLELEAAEAPDLWRLVALLTNLRPPARLPRTLPILIAGDVELTPAKLAFSDVRAQLGPNTLEVNGELASPPPSNSISTLRQASPRPPMPLPSTTCAGSWSCPGAVPRSRAGQVSGSGSCAGTTSRCNKCGPSCSLAPTVPFSTI